MAVVSRKAIIAGLLRNPGSVAVMFQAIQAFDLSVLWWMRSFHEPIIVWLAWAVATLAWKGWLWWTIIVSTWLRGSRQFSAHLASALILATIAGLPLKGLIARPRPDLYASQQLNIPMPELLTTAHSFPSGHTLLASAFAFVVFAYCKDARAWLAFAFVLLVGLARIYQGLHWPSDVAGSILLGALAAWSAGFVLRIPSVQRLTGGSAKSAGASAARPAPAAMASTRDR